MAKMDDTGVYQLKGGNWAYRYTITENGRKKDVRKAKDDNGNPFNTKREAIKARLIAIGREQEGNKPKPKDRKTIAEVYAEYCESGRESKAYTTIRKQESLWENHLCARFGKRYVDDIVNHFVCAARGTYVPETGLFCHAFDDVRAQFWCDKETGRSAHTWNRALGWYTMAIVETLQYLGVNEQTQPMVEILTYIADTLPRYADPESGMWYQVVEFPGREGNYEESTGSIMYIYTMLKALRLGYLPESYRDAWMTRYRQFVDRFLKLEEDGTISITNCCAVAGLDTEGTRRDGSYDYYLSEPVRDNDPKATGPFIWAAMEYDRAR